MAPLPKIILKVQSHGKKGKTSTKPPAAVCSKDDKKTRKRKVDENGVEITKPAKQNKKNPMKTPAMVLAMQEEKMPTPFMETDADNSGNSMRDHNDEFTLYSIMPNDETEEPNLLQSLGLRALDKEARPVLGAGDNNVEGVGQNALAEEHNVTAQQDNLAGPDDGT